jgi:hypothetical protein
MLLLHIGGGKKSLCGEGKITSSASMTFSLSPKTGALAFLFLLIPALVLVDYEGTAIFDWGVGVGSSLK